MARKGVHHVAVISFHKFVLVELLFWKPALGVHSSLGLSTIRKYCR